MAKKTNSIMESPMRMKPYLHLQEKDLPAIKNWKVGETYTIEVKAKQKSMSLDDTGVSAGFEIIKLNPQKGKYKGEVAFGGQKLKVKD